MQHLDSAMGVALHPTRLVAFIRRVAGPAWRASGRAAVLEVVGRRSGRTVRVNLIPVDLDGSTYVLAFGGVTEWSRNLKATPRATLVRRGRRTDFTAVEIGGDLRERVIDRYLRGTGPLKRDFYRRPASADHPTFRADPVQ